MNQRTNSHFLKDISPSPKPIHQIFKLSEGKCVDVERECFEIEGGRPAGWFLLVEITRYGSCRVWY